MIYMQIRQITQYLLLFLDYFNSCKVQLFFRQNKVNIKILMEIELKTIERLGHKHQYIQELPQLKIVNSQNGQSINDQEEKVPFLDLFRFARTKEIVLMICGTICASALGVSYPMFSFLWGDMIDSLVTVNNNPSNFPVTPSTLINPNIVDGTRKILIEFVYLGIGAFIVGWGMFASWMLAGSRLAAQCRKQYLSKLMEQEMQWFDRSNQSQLASKFASDCASFQMAVSQKISALITILSSFLVGLILAFFKGWMMTIAVLIIQPLIVFGWILLVRVTANKISIEQKAYSKASSKMEQAFSSIKTVKQLNGEEHEKIVYDSMLQSGVQSMKQFARKKGLAIGCSNFFLLFSYITSYWYGSACIEGTVICPPHLNGGLTYTAGNVLTIFFSLLLPALNLSQLFPSFQKIIEGRAAAFRIYSIIDRESKVQSPLQPLIPQTFKGVFTFQQVTFAYPKDKTKNILNKFNCEINTANAGLVGKSGCGKSTVFQLMMRFYDPDSGCIFLDGNDLRILDLEWLRRQIGYVGQEPVLFATSIKQNLRMSRPQATEQQIIVALKQAEAFDFVNTFPNGLQTYVGSGGSQVSGGQKQRLAIARALLKNPRILLLDEATSSLDRKNEELIEETLNKIANTLQIITISHSITTIRRCQKIIVIEQGKLKEQGPYSSLRYFDSNTKQKEFTKLYKEQKQKNFIDNQQQAESIIQVNHIDNFQQNSINQKQQKLLQKSQLKQSVLLRVLSYGEGYKFEMFFGIIAAILVGCTFPVFSIFFGKILANELTFKIDPSQSRRRINQYACIQLGIIVVQIFTIYFQHYLLLTVGTKITQQIRSEVFLKIIKMPVPWFQRKNNISGKLTTDIFTDFRNINTFSSQILHSILFIISSLCVGIIAALFYEWRIALISLALLPLLGLSGFIQFFIFLGFREGNNKTATSASQIVNQAVCNIRTVLTLGNQVIIERYEQSLNSDYESMVRKSNIAGFFYGLSFMILFITIALIFYIASIFTQQHNLDVQNVFPSIFIILFVGITVGNSINYIPDTSAARDSANHIFSILDADDQDQIQVKQQSKLLKTPIKGKIAFQAVDFKYESRTELTLSNVSFQVKEGERVNFVGPSGCGKSTIIQLLIGFYQPLKGNIWIDGVLLKDYDIHHLRSCFGVVSQEPILFNETIKYNIKYNHPTATDEEIVEAAQESNYNPENERLLQRVSSSEGKGFDINVGIRGSHLSGGQKQRVAIARTILRNPHVLLLDEATSALDPTNEQIVQDSLNRLMTGKTTINVTHKVNTIKTQQKILIFKNGKIVEDMKRQNNVSVKGNHPIYHKDKEY